MSTYEVTGVTPRTNTINILWDGVFSKTHKIPLNEDGSILSGPELKAALLSEYPADILTKFNAKPSLSDAYLLSLVGKTGTFFK